MKQNPDDKLRNVEQELLGYNTDQLTELKRRTEEFGHLVFDKALETFSENPAHYNANPKDLQFKLASFVKDKIQGTFSPEEIIAEFAVQRACVTLQMMQGYADEQAKKNKRN